MIRPLYRATTSAPVSLQWEPLVPVVNGDPHTTSATIFAQTADAAIADPHGVFPIRDLFECCDPANVSHPMTNSLRKRGFPIPPKRTWMFLGIRCDVLAVARIFGVAVHSGQNVFAVSAEVQRSAPFCFNRAVGQRIRVPQLCAPRAPASFQS